MAAIGFIETFLFAPVIAMFTVSLFPLLQKVLRGNEEPNPLFPLTFAVVGVVLSFALLMVAPHEGRVVFSGALVIDGLARWGALLVLLSLLVTSLLLHGSAESRNRHFTELIFLLLNSAVGMMLVAAANDFMMLFIGIEVMSLCLYIAIALGSDERISKEAAFKYFVLGAFASAILLYGIALVFGTTGQFRFDAIGELADQLSRENRLFQLGVALVLVGLLFKASIFPFHTWTPDVYQGAAAPLTVLMASGVKAVSFIALVRFVRVGIIGYEGSESLAVVVEWLAALTMMAGNIGAFGQTNLKRLLGYSSVAHSGYMLMGVLVVGTSLQEGMPLGNLLFYVVTYVVMSIGVFGFLSVLESGSSQVSRVEDLAGLGKARPWFGLTFAILLLSLGGLPPLVGFFSKFFIFSGAVEKGLYWLAFWGVVSSVIGVAVYLRPVMVMYMKDLPSDERQRFSGIEWSPGWVFVAMAAATMVILGIAAGSAKVVVDRVLS